MKLLNRIKNLFFPNSEVILAAQLEAAKLKRLDVAEKLEDAKVNVQHLQALRASMEERVARLQAERDRIK